MTLHSWQKQDLCSTNEWSLKQADAVSSSYGGKMITLTIELLIFKWMFLTSVQHSLLVTVIVPRKKHPLTTRCLWIISFRNLAAKFLCWQFFKVSQTWGANHRPDKNINIKLMCNSSGWTAISISISCNRGNVGCTFRYWPRHIYLQGGFEEERKNKKRDFAHLQQYFCKV